MRDVIVRGGTLVLPEGRRIADLAIDGGSISEVRTQLSGAREEIDARGLHVFPGLIDVHLDFSEPGRAEWEGAETGGRALAAGGGTTFFDMPLNSSPPTVTAEEVERKRICLETASVADFGIWGGLIPGSVREMAAMAAAGVVGFKAFMCDSGLPEFPRVDEKTLDGMGEAARLGLPVAVHAEDDAMTRRLSSEMPGSSARHFLDSRPVAAEVQAIGQAVEMAAATGVMLHIHVSSGSGAARAAEARAQGVDVSVETCPHYLLFTEEDLDRIGVAAKCAPPLRSAGEHGRLWEELLNGRVDVIASDHSPSHPSLKKEGDFRASWGGIAGVQSTLAVLLERGSNGRRLRFERIASLIAANPAARFRIPRKGSLAAGYDADLTLLDPCRSYRLDAANLQQRHKSSPYIGSLFTGTVVRTIRRGETIFKDGRIVASSRGRLVRPTRAPAGRNPLLPGSPA